MKRTYFCVDVSGSISDADLETAIMTVNARSSIGDFVLLFDAMVHGIWPVEDVLGRPYGDPADLLRSLFGKEIGRGGSAANEVPDAIAAHMKKHNVAESHKVLLSDLQMLASDLALFDEKINIHP